MSIKKNVTNQKVLASALAKQLASREVSNQHVSALAKELSTAKFLPKRVDICQYGICFDYHVKADQMAGLINDLGAFRVIKVFPWGIPFPEEFHVHVERALG